MRFDTIAAATQRFTEEMLLEWVRRCVETTGIRDIVAGGGVFMNVKANMLIAQLPEVTSLYVMPSAGDESLVDRGGAASLLSAQRHRATTAPADSRPLSGRRFRPPDEETAVAVGTRARQT